MSNIDTPILPKPAGNLGLWAEQLIQVLTLWFQRQSQSGIPAGTPMPYLGTEAPPGYLELNGQVVSQQTYRGLYKVLGDRYNTGGEGAGNFRLPDATGRTFMQDDTDLYGGADEITLTLAKLPDVAVTVTDPGHLHSVASVMAPSSTANVGGGGTSVTTGTNVTRTTSLTTTGITARLPGGGEPISIKPKYFGGIWIIKT